MQKVEAVRSARQDRFHDGRMQKAKAGQVAAERRALEQEIHLVRAPGALAKDKEAKLKGEARAGQRCVVWRLADCMLKWLGPGCRC